MAAPTITWYQYASAGGAANSLTISTLSFGTVTAGQWAGNKCIKVKVAGNDVTNLRLWLADSAAVVNGSPVSLGKTSKAWDFIVTCAASIGTYTALFSGKGGWTAVGTTLATDYRSAPKNSLGAGKSLGTGVTNTVVSGAKSKAAFLSVKPHASAYDGVHTGFAYQVGYDFT
jgi:hypothetical protein